jgi:hypothetical protein
VGVDLVDNKLPSVGLLMSVPYRLIGADWHGYAALGLAMTTTAALLLARAARRCLGDHAFWPVLVAGTVWMNFPPAVFGLLQLETVQCFFITLAAGATLELLVRHDWKDAVTAGLCVGTAMFAKPTAAALLPAAAVTILLFGNWNIPTRLRLLGCLTLGAALPLALCAYLLMVTGMADTLPATLAQLREYSSNSTADFSDVFKPAVVVTFLLFPLAVLGIVFRRDRLTDQTVTPQASARRAVAAFVVAWFVFELIGVIAQRRMYAYHFLVLAPPAALLIGLPRRRLRTLSLTMAFGPAAALCGAWAVQMYHWPDYDARPRAVLAYLASHTQSGDTVWMDDYPRLLVETDLLPGSVVPLTFLFTNSDAAPLTFSQRILADFETRRPKYVVLHSDPQAFIAFYQTNMAELAAYPRRRENFATAWQAIDAYVRQRYVVESSVSGKDILLRRDLATADSLAQAPRR